VTLGTSAAGAVYTYHYDYVKPNLDNALQMAKANTCTRVWENYTWAKRQLREAQADYKIAQQMARSDRGANLAPLKRAVHNAEVHADAMLVIAKEKCSQRSTG